MIRFTTLFLLNQIKMPLLAIGIGAGVVNPLVAAKISETETLVSGIASYDAFDDQGGSRSLNFADIELNLEIDFLLPEITSTGGPTNATLEIDFFSSWAPDNGHAEPTDVGEHTSTFSIPIVIAEGATQASTTVTESVPLLSYTENTFAFDQPYGVLLINAIARQAILGTYRGSGLAISASVSGESTVIYDYTNLEVPEPTTSLLSFLGISLLGITKRNLPLPG